MTNKVGVSKETCIAALRLICEDYASDGVCPYDWGIKSEECEGCAAPLEKKTRCFMIYYVNEAQKEDGGKNRVTRL